MAKKLTILLICVLSIAFFQATAVYADDNKIRGDFFIKNVVINGEKIVNYNLQYSIVLVEDVMYLPLTREMCEIYGIEVEMDWENSVLKLFRTESTRKNISDNNMKNDAKPLHFNAISDATVFAYEKEVSYYIYNTMEKVEAPEMRVGEIDLKGLPLLETDKVLYIPLRALSEDKHFDWDVYFYSYYGVSIGTSFNISAETFIDRKEALENRGLVNYMIRINSTIGPSYGQQLVFLFKRAGEVYNVDPRLLMAVARTESRFNTGAIGRGGAAGMMQFMPRTGERYGLSVEQLLDPKTGIDFGALYLSERIEAFEGSWLRALSAYNQGSTRVNRGNYTYTYANMVMANYERIEEYLVTHGFIL